MVAKINTSDKIIEPLIIKLVLAGQIMPAFALEPKLNASAKSGIFWLVLQKIEIQVFTAAMQPIVQASDCVISAIPAMAKKHGGYKMKISLNQANEAAG